MKKFLVCTLVLTLIFPAYCFGQPQEDVPIKKILDGLFTDKEIIDEIVFIMEDGVVELEEIEVFITLANNITPQQGTLCEIALYLWMISFVTTLLKYMDGGRPGVGGFMTASLQLLFCCALGL